MKKLSIILALCMICTLLFGAVAQAAGNEYDATNWGAVSRGEIEAPEEVEEYVSPMEELSRQMKKTADRRAKDDDVYWKVTVDKLEANYDISSSVEGAKIVNIDLSWDGENGVPRSKIMLRMFSDDMAQSIFDAYAGENITQLWCRWAVPYLVDDDGFIAKYKYEQEGETVYLTDSNGLLFNMPDDYK